MRGEVMKTYNVPCVVDEAIADYTKTIALRPKDAHAYLGRGHAHLFKGDYGRAAIDYRKAASLNPPEDSLTGLRDLLGVRF
jgi:tetratricopeptide (TPR) repeat protein